MKQVSARRNKRAKGEGSIRYIEKKGLYEGRVVIGINSETGKPIYKSIYDKKQKNVVQKMRDIMQSIGKGDYVEPSNKTLITWIKEWYELYKEPSIKANTKDKYFYSIKRIEDSSISNLRLKEINHELLQKYYNSIKNDYSTETIKATHSVINGSMQKAESVGMLSRNPAKDIILPKGIDKDENKEIKALTDDEYKDFISEMKNRSVYYAFMVFVANTGLRVNEAIALERSDFDIKKKVVYVGKTYVRSIKSVQNSAKTLTSKRTIPVPDSVCSMMKEYMLKQPNQGTSDPLFQTLTGNHITDRNALRAIQDISKDKSYSWMNLHTLRHTYASRLFAQKVDVKIISKLLGHAKVSTTYDIYVHFINDAVEEAVQLLNDDSISLPTKKTRKKAAKVKQLKRTS